MTKIALIDGGFLYRCAFGCEKGASRFLINKESKDISKKERKTEEEQLQKSNTEYNLINVCKVQPVEYCLHSLKLRMNKILTTLETERYYLYLDPMDKSCFRYELATLKGPRGYGYKFGRSRRPIWYNEARQYLIDYWKGIEVIGMEADDAVAIQHYSLKGDTVICSDDKDLNTVPGKHYNVTKDDYYEISELNAQRAFYAQMLSGDRADNIPGIKGLGDIKSARLMNACLTEEKMVDVVVQEYKKQYKGDYIKAMLEVAQLLWILRDDMGQILPKIIQDIKG